MSPGIVACATPKDAAAGRAGSEDRLLPESGSSLEITTYSVTWPSPSDWRVCAWCPAARVWGTGSWRSHAPRLLPPDAQAGPAPRQPFPGSSPLPSSGPRAPRAPPQVRARSRALARSPALSARARLPDDAGVARAGQGELRFPAAEPWLTEAAPSVQRPERVGAAESTDTAAAAVVRKTGWGRRACWS